MAVLKPTPSEYYLWDYVPSRVAAIAFAVAFLLGVLAVTWRSIRTRTMFAIPFIVGGIFEVGGYAARAAAQDITDSLPPYIAQYLLILVAPALFAASIYMILGRVIRSTGGEHHSLLQPTKLTRTFVTGDVITFLTQVIGGSLQSMKKFNRTTAERIVLVGLIIQIIIFGIFTVVAMIWHRRMKKSRSPEASQIDTNGTWEPTLYMLYAVSVLIMIRSVFRVIEYGMGRDNYLLQHEWTMYAFDGALMTVAVFVYASWYPGELHTPNKDQELGAKEYAALESGYDTSS